MSMFPNRSRLSDPTTLEVVPDEDFTYAITRAQLDAFKAVHEELAKSGIQRKQLAKRMGMNEGQLSRLLGAPGNWGLGTIAKLLWAICGGRVRFNVEYPIMTLREIPKTYKFVCDLCGQSVMQVNNSRPSYWSQLILKQDAYDFQGSAVADGTVVRDLCKDCTTRVTNAINALKSE